MTVRILINDPLFEEGVRLFEPRGYHVTKARDLHKMELPKIGEYIVLIVRSTNNVHADLIHKAKKQRIMVVNTSHIDTTSDKSCRSPVNRS